MHLTRGEYVHVKGRGENRTDLKVKLYHLNDDEKETIFENCVADVNIPVGEVFTSPVLEGTSGVLHVSRVYLEGLQYTDLELAFEDGKITDYRCGNFDDPEEGRRYIEDNVLKGHQSLPLGGVCHRHEYNSLCNRKEIRYRGQDARSSSQRRRAPILQ